MRHLIRRPAALLVALLVALGLANVLATTSTTGAAAGVPPSASKSDKPGQAWVRSTVARMNLRELVGQLFMTYAYGDAADTQDPAHVAANQELYGVDNTAELVERSGMSVIPGLTPFIFRFAVNEALEKGIPPQQGTHPPVECRMYRLGAPALEKLSQSPEAQAGFARSGLSSPSEFRQTLKNLEPRCAP